MIESIFIIDLLETVIYKKPENIKSDIYQELQQKIKKSCIKYCKEPNYRYVKNMKISHKGRMIKKRVMARANDQNVIVVLIVSLKIKNERKIWGIIDDIFDVLSIVDVNEPKEFKEVVPELEKMMYQLDLNDKKVLFRTSDSQIGSDRTILGSSIRIGNSNSEAIPISNDSTSKNLLFILVGGLGAVLLLILMELAWNRELIFK